MGKLMPAGLDKQYKQLRPTTHALEDLDTGRSAMCKQAEAKTAMATKHTQAPDTVPQTSAEVARISKRPRPSPTPRFAPTTRTIRLNYPAEKSGEGFGVSVEARSGSDTAPW